MKTIKLTLIALLLTSSVVVLAHDDTKISGKKSKKEVTDMKKGARISLEHALNMQGMIQQIYLQVSPDNVLSDPSAECIHATVNLNHVDYFINGNYEQWALLFRKHTLPPTYVNPEKD